MVKKERIRIEMMNRINIHYLIGKCHGVTLLVVQVMGQLLPERRAGISIHFRLFLGG
eukprot:gnl/Chilomastix_caulleri/3206.p2 GENE.gnl/Chilomastix_caulleri/3206~~gnl/Chilomastix_caulleri/3206.p2  ORF type:complete len:57 (-),score=3.05 gnl/Chilomastix_caulleri/3206:318-488(-)